MTRWFLALLCLAAWSAAGFAWPKVKLLSSAEAAAVEGGVLIDDRTCNHGSSDCDFYNYVQGTFSTCGESGTCGDCEIDEQWDTCVTKTASQCDWLGNGNDCGKKRVGTCAGGACIGLTPTATNCLKAPKCQ